jgi:hypothetical protein
MDVIASFRPLLWHIVAYQPFESNIDLDYIIYVGTYLNGLWKNALAECGTLVFLLFSVILDSRRRSPCNIPCMT